MSGERVEVAKIPKKEAKETDALKLCTILCYYYPQYTLREAMNLPYKYVVMMLKTAKEQRAIEHQNLLAISVAPHAKGQAKKLDNYFRRIING